MCSQSSRSEFQTQKKIAIIKRFRGKKCMKKCRDKGYLFSFVFQQKNQVPYLPIISFNPGSKNCLLQPL